MIRFFNAFSRSWFGPAIMGAIVIALGLLGSSSVRSLFGGARLSNVVVSAGAHSVTPNQFQKMFQRHEQEYLQRSGQPFPLEDALKQGFDKDMLQQLSTQSAYYEFLSRSGIRPSDEVVAIELRRQAESGQAPGLAQIFDAVTGKFQPKALNALLANNGISMAEFQRELADSIADGDLSSAMHEGFQLPRIYAAVQAALLLESRDVSYFVIPLAGEAPPPKPTDDQLRALMQAHKDQLTLPERRKLTIVRFSAKAIAPTLTVDPKAVEQQFEAKKASYAKPETRSLVEIPLNDPKEAGAVVAALNKGEDPAAVAKSIGANVIPYADQPQSAIADAKAGAVAFSMKEGEVRGPVQGDFKTAVLKVLKVTPAQAPDLNAARAQIEAELRQNQAVNAIIEQTQKFDDLRDGGDSIAAAAAKLGLQVISVGPVPANGKDPLTGQVNPALTQKLLTTAFQTNQGADSDVEQDGDKGEYYAVHVDQVIAPNLPGLDEPGIRQMVTQAYIQQAVVDALQKKAADAEAALKAGKSIESVAASYHATVAHQVGLQRAGAQQYMQTYGQDFLAATFGEKAGQLFAVGSNPLKGYAVGRIDAVRPADPKQMAQVLIVFQQRGGQTYMEGLMGATQQAALRTIKPSTDLALARNAMNVDPAMAARVDKANAAGGAKPAK